MAPSRLDHADFRIGEEMNRSLKQIARRNEICVENADEFAIGRFQSHRERAGLETSAIDAMNQLNVVTALAQFCRAGRGNFASIVRGVIEDLDLEQLARIIDFADRTEQSLDDVDLVKNRQLDGDLWQLLKPAGGGRSVFAMFKEKINDEIPVHTIGRQTDKDGEITGRPNHIAEASLHKVSCQY